MKYKTFLVIFFIVKNGRCLFIPPEKSGVWCECVSSVPLPHNPPMLVTKQHKIQKQIQKEISANFLGTSRPWRPPPGILPWLGFLTPLQEWILETQSEFKKWICQNIQIFPFCTDKCKERNQFQIFPVCNTNGNYCH